jgi:hypothetical protein
MAALVSFEEGLTKERRVQRIPEHYGSIGDYLAHVSVMGSLVQRETLANSNRACRAK